MILLLTNSQLNMLLFLQYVENDLICTNQRLSTILSIFASCFPRELQILHQSLSSLHLLLMEA